ncbi:MAG: hypothetical protein JJT90_14285 [Ectothiorhodospiraceae bacterium]|nr:hypothetical protein [Ectothiorhodospiraceae bacterium]
MAVVIPTVAVLPVSINVLGDFKHRQLHRGALGLLGKTAGMAGSLHTPVREHNRA